MKGMLMASNASRKAMPGVSKGSRVYDNKIGSIVLGCVNTSD